MFIILLSLVHLQAVYHLVELLGRLEIGYAMCRYVHAGTVEDIASDTLLTRLDDKTAESADEHLIAVAQAVFDSLCEVFYYCANRLLVVSCTDSNLTNQLSFSHSYIVYY